MPQVSDTQCPLVPTVGQTWRHFKGGRYTILAVGRHSETQEEMVVYQSDETGDVTIRPLSMWNDYVERPDMSAFDPMMAEPVKFKRFKLVVRGEG